ncbi:MAG: EcsC family protein [Armatimonadota bacterium]
MRILGSASGAVAEVGDAVLRGTLSLIGDATLTTVSRTSALGRYERAGHKIEDVTQIRSLDVSVPDRIVGRVCRVWIAVAGATGVATSATGAVGLAADIPALLANNLMAVGEIASVYGFDVAEEEESAYAMALLFARHSEGRGGRGTRAHLRRIARDLREGASWSDIRDEKAGRWLRDAARDLVWYLVKRKAAGVIPGVGSLVAGGVNAQFTARTCREAREAYRERFISETRD